MLKNAIDICFYSIKNSQALCQPKIDYGLVWRPALVQISVYISRPVYRGGGWGGVGGGGGGGGG